MALSDPTNVRVGEARKRALLAKLAQQLASRGSRTQGTGARIGSVVGLKTGGARGIGLPPGLARMMQSVGLSLPAGYDPQASFGGDMPAVIPSGGPAGAGAGGPVAASAPTGNLLDLPPTPPEGSTYIEAPGHTFLNGDTTFGSGKSLESGSGSFGGGASYPDPYTLLADLQMKRILQSGTAYGI